MVATQLSSNLEKRGLTVEEFLRMAQTGILREDERIELIQGEMFRMTPIGDYHAWVLMFLNRILVSQLGTEFPISLQGPLRLSHDVYVEPDVVVFDRWPPDVNHTLMGPANVHLLIEVADTSLVYDRKIKIPLYATFGIEEVWLVDLTRQMVIVHRNAGSEAYTSVSEHGREEKITAIRLPRLIVDINLLFKGNS